MRVAALLGNDKAKQWVEGRRKRKPLDKLKSLFHRKGDANASKSAAAERSRSDEEPISGDWIWFHAASLGEFEQGRPVIEALKEEYPQYKILLSFFSPSGYEVRKDYPLADEVVYLPTDTPHHAAQWVQSRHFVAVFFIKYEFWFNYMRALKKAGIPLFYISLILKPDSYFFRSYGGRFRKLLHNVTHFFVQDDITAELLKTYGFDNVTVSGDTRFDRVAAIARQAKPFPDIERFIVGRQCIIAGSTWPPDEKLLVHFLPQLPDNYCLIIAPHDISESHVAQIKTMFPESQCYTELDLNKPSKVLIVNTIGILSQLYQYARFVYIGGGFGVNIHNIQEPVTFGCPVVFGPKYKSFKEAVDLVALQGAFSIKDAVELEDIFLRLMTDDTLYKKASETCINYLNSQVGATEKILKGFKNILFL